MAAIDTFLDRVRTTRMLVVGDVMVDAYLWGRVDRISPEAPVPVVQVTERSARLGGAANVAINAHVLGARPVVVTVIGQDANADLMERLFRDQGLSTAGLLRSPQRRRRGGGSTCRGVRTCRGAVPSGPRSRRRCARGWRGA